MNKITQPQGRIASLLAHIHVFFRRNREINRIVYTVDKKLYAISWICTVATGLLEIGSLGAFGYGLQAFGSQAMKGQPISPTIIMLGGVILIGTTVIRETIRALDRFRQNMCRHQLFISLDRQRAQKVISLDIARLKMAGFEKVLQDANERGRDAIIDIWQGQLEWANALVVALCSMTIICKLDSFLLIIAFMPVIPEILCSLRIRKRDRDMWEAQYMDRRYKAIYEYCLTRIERVTQTKLFEGVGVMMHNYLHFQGRIESSYRHQQWFSFKNRIYLTALSLLCLLTGFVYMAKNVLIGTMSIGAMYTLYGMIRSFRGSIGNFVGEIVDIFAFQKEYEYYEKLMAQKPLLVENQARDVEFPETPSIGFSKVTFGYPRDDEAIRIVLQNCDLSIKPGRVVAVVGPNGSGKSTALNLMLKQYAPDSGSILIGGMPLATVSQQSWISHIACMTQSFSIVNFKIAMAVTYRHEKDIDFERLKAASRISGADEFVAKLMHGYRTQIGSDWPEGVEFSGGQAQRLMLTAALYRLMDPRVKIGLFDEPMASCDAQTKRRFYQTITDGAAFKGKTIVVVGHDPSFLPLFQEVILFENGSVRTTFTDPGEIGAYCESLDPALASEE